MSTLLANYNLAINSARVAKNLRVAGDEGRNSWMTSEKQPDTRDSWIRENKTRWATRDAWISLKLPVLKEITTPSLIYSLPYYSPAGLKDSDFLNRLLTSLTFIDAENINISYLICCLYFDSIGECIWLHIPLIKSVLEFCRRLFPVVSYGYTTIPTYPSGQIGFILCSKNKVRQF